MTPFQFIIFVLLLLQMIEPKKAKLVEAKLVYDKQIEIIFQKQLELAKLEDQLLGLREQMDIKMIDYDRCKEKFRLTEVKLERAESLIQGLEEETVRWQEELEQLQNIEPQLIGKSILKAACLIYIGPLDQRYRQNGGYLATT
ncbi:unnamed protein product [Protopolystoma xenopodis]|uniref:Dynein heavy chain coiled coil stalk domain-containing protein n=1 Tax=Protopolystoma xenopodis TaxID=117903 RepID=A0A448WF96_9PLAT|nr:unnamed protein product [Protopolystoma xenopodis]